MGIVEHGNVGLAAAGQIAGAGFEGITEGMQAKIQMDAQLAATEERRMRMQRLDQQFDLEEQQRQSESEFNTLQARLGKRGLRVDGQDQLYLDDDGSTELPGVQYSPINFSQQEMAVFQKMSPTAQKARLGELENERGAARKQAEIQWLGQRANEILSGGTIYGNPDGSEMVPGMVEPADGMRLALMEAIQAFSDDPTMDVREANRMLRTIGDGIFDAQKAARVRQQVGASLFALHEAAMVDEGGLGVGDNLKAEHVEWVMKEWAAGDMDDATALSLAGTGPDDLDRILNWGFTRQAKGMQQFAPQGAPGVGQTVASVGGEQPAPGPVATGGAPVMGDAEPAPAVLGPIPTEANLFGGFDMDAEGYDAQVAVVDQLLQATVAGNMEAVDQIVAAQNLTEEQEEALASAISTEATGYDPDEFDVDKTLSSKTVLEKINKGRRKKRRAGGARGAKARGEEGERTGVLDVIPGGRAVESAIDRSAAGARRYEEDEAERSRRSAEAFDEAQPKKAPAKKAKKKAEPSVKAKAAAKAAKARATKKKAKETKTVEDAYQERLRLGRPKIKGWAKMTLAEKRKAILKAKN